MERSRFAACLALLVVSGCGARSTLLEVDPSPSTGAGGGSSSSSGGGDCVGLPRGETIPLAASSSEWSTRPTLALSSDDGAFVTALFGSSTLGEPGFDTPRLAHTSLRPWGTWPPTDLGSTFPLHDVGGASFAIARHPGNSFAVLYGEDPAKAPLEGVTLVPSISVGQSGNAGAIVVDPQARSALFLTAGAEHLGGYQRFGDTLAHPDVFQLAMARSFEGPAGTALHPPVHLGCATTSMIARAVPSGDGFLIALSNGTALGDVACFDDALVGAATQIQIARVDASGVVTLGAVIGDLYGDGFTAPPWLELTARPDGGAFLVWYQPWMGAGSLPEGIRAVIVDPSGALGGESFAVTGSVTGSTDRPYESGFAIDHLGDDLVVAWLHDPSGEFDASLRIIVERLDPQGTVLTVDDLPAEGSVTAPLSVLASPTGEAFLVGWSSTKDPTVEPSQLHLARYGCARP